MTPQKLKIIPLTNNVTEVTQNPQLANSEAFEVQFNPEKFTISKSYNYTPRTNTGKDDPDLEFGGGNSGRMNMELTFDSSKDTDMSVRLSYIDLIEFAQVKPSGNDDGKGEPRQVVVLWGNFQSFISVIESITEDFTYFAPNGTPLRATVSLHLTEFIGEPDGDQGSTNPTSRTEARRTWVVEKGQRIEWIAYNVYGATSAWRHLAETNDLLNPGVLRPGQILKITPMR